MVAKSGWLVAHTHPIVFPAHAASPPHGQPPLAKSSKRKKTTFWVAEPKPTTDMPDRHAGWWVPYRRS